MMDSYKKIIESLDARVKKSEPLSRYTTFKIGGPTDLFYEARTTDELVKAVKLARGLEVPCLILGGGSNILVSDEGFQGLVIKVQSASRRTKFKVQNEKVSVEAGMPLGELVSQTAKKGLSGLEFAAGIPGTVGGAVVGNAGAWQQTIGNKISRVKVLTPEGEIKWIDGRDCQFAYRQSRFQKSKEVILTAELLLKKEPVTEIKKRIKLNLKKREGQPKEPSVGSIFKNPESGSAGRMIDQCGLKGKRIGDTQISPQHANFIVNLGQAKARDVLKLINLIKKEVKKKFGIELKEEICLVGFDKI